jgi:hypothetical protein
MKTDDLENELRNLRFTHLTEGELAAYCDQELDQIGLARAEAHVKQCFICDRKLELLREENAALSRRVISDDDVAFVDRLMEQTRPAREPSIKATKAAGDVPLRELLSEYLQQMTASLQLAFRPVRGEVVWQWESTDHRLRAHATIETNNDMTIHFSSSEMDLEGARIHFRRGSFYQETTLRRVSESKVAAQVIVPLPNRKEKTTDLSIEII